MNLVQEVVILAILLIVGVSAVVSLGNMLAPVFAGMVIAFLLEGIVRGLQRLHVPRLPAVLLVFVVFMTALLLVLFFLLPLLSQQLTELVVVQRSAQVKSLAHIAAGIRQIGERLGIFNTISNHRF